MDGYRVTQELGEHIPDSLQNNLKSNGEVRPQAVFQGKG
jgi:hypothetical protein